MVYNNTMPFVFKDGHRIRVCRCGSFGPFFAANSSKSASDHLDSLCKVCKLKRSATRNKENPERKRASNKRYRQAHPDRVTAHIQRWVNANLEKHRAADRAWALKNPESKQNSRLKGRYGLSLAEYGELFKAQKGLCALCDEPMLPGGPRTEKPSVDHDHTCCPVSKARKACGKCVRGLIHIRCNTGLGAFKDDMTLLQKGINFLKRYEAKKRGP
jgi:hypothetical protein